MIRFFRWGQNVPEALFNRFLCVLQPPVMRIRFLGSPCLWCSPYFGNFGTVIFSGAPVRDFKNSTKSTFSSGCNPNGLVNSLR